MWDIVELWEEVVGWFDLINLSKIDLVFFIELYLT